MSKRWVLCGVVLAGLMLMMVAGCGSKVSKDNYDKIKTGMTLAEVENILGKGELQAGGAGGLGDLLGSAKVYKWTDGEKSIMVTFANDKVTVKAQTGI